MGKRSPIYDGGTGSARARKKTGEDVGTNHATGSRAGPGVAHLEDKGRRHAETTGWGGQGQVSSYGKKAFGEKISGLARGTPTLSEGILGAPEKVGAKDKKTAIDQFSRWGGRMHSVINLPL